MNSTPSLCLISPQPGRLAGFNGWGAGVYLVLAAGLAMLAWGSMAHKTAWIIPGALTRSVQDSH